MNAFKLSLLRAPILSSLFVPLFFGSGTTIASPSRSYQTQADCWNNHDFISPQNNQFRYCLLENGSIRQIDNSGRILKDKITLNKLKKERSNANQFRQIDSNSKANIKYIEYKIQDDELVKYSCKNKKNNRKYEPTKECIRTRIGIRPFAFYYRKGLTSQQLGKWNESIKYFTKQIDIYKIRNIYYQRALSKYKVNDHLGSLEDLNQAIKNYPSFLYSYDLRSKVKNLMNDYRGEQKDLTILIGLLNNKVEEGLSNMNSLKDYKYVKKGSSAYYLVEGPTWEKAHQKARETGGRLVTINNLKENSWLVRNFSDEAIFYNKDFEGQYWIGFKYKTNKFRWISSEPATFTNWKIATPSKDITSPAYAKIIFYTLGENTKYSSGKWDVSSSDNPENLYGIAEKNIATKFDQIDLRFKNIYFRRALSRSELGDSKAAIRDFDMELINNPTFGQAYLQRGLEKYWINRKAACADLLKAVSLGADVSRRPLLLDAEINNSSLISECKTKNNYKVDRVKKDYRFEETISDVLTLLGKYYILAPIFIIVIFYLIVKNKED